VVILLIIDAGMGLRVPEEEEYEGLDLSQHGESGYNMEDGMSTSLSNGGAHH
jgi:Amt family ammonium transporter